MKGAQWVVKDGHEKLAVVIGQDNATEQKRAGGSEPRPADRTTRSKSLDIVVKIAEDGFN